VQPAVTSAQCGIHTQITRRLIGPSLNCTQNERVDGWDFFLGILEHHVVEVDDHYYSTSTTRASGARNNLFRHHFTSYNILSSYDFISETHPGVRCICKNLLLWHLH